MPHQQYDMITEIRLRSNLLEVQKIEQAEEEMFNNILSKTENKVIDLVDLVFPSRFRKQNGRPIYYPTLPVRWRKQATELLQRTVLDGKFPINFNERELKLAFDQLLLKKTMDIIVNGVPLRIWSCAVVEYDITGSAVVDASSLPSTNINTRLFIELLIENNTLPLELLNFKVVCDIFLEWNQKRLQRLPYDLKNEEGWPLIDCVSLFSGVFMLKSCVSDQHVITGFETELSINNQPLRSRHEEQGNMIEHINFVRVKGQIDSGKLPPEIVEMGKRWNEALRLIQDAMRLGRIKYADGRRVTDANVRVDEISFKAWAEKRGYHHLQIKDRKFNGPSDLLKDEKQSRSNSMNQLILDYRNTLIKETNQLPNNKSVWDCIYKDKDEIEIIEDMDRWSDREAKITWNTEHGGKRVMLKKSFQTFLSKIKSQNM